VPAFWHGAFPAEFPANEGFAKAGDTIVVTGGMPFGISGGTNLLRIAQLPLQHGAG
jgi:hypothetical protein